MTESTQITTPTQDHRKRTLVIILLVLIILVGAFLRFYQLGSSSYGNLYYAATVKSMLSSWHNFFYAAYEPGGSVSVDKPPLGFWLQALSAYFLGINGFTLALPQALAGVLSIPLLFFLVKRPYGPWAGLVSALILAVTPITIATERNNTIDGTLVLVLLSATWALLESIHTGKFRYLLLCMFLVGIGFNIKMLQAYMILPMVGLVYLIAAPQRWWKRFLHLVVATLLMLVVSLAWVVAFDLTPASERPYAGSSSENSMLELVIGHNGLARLERMRPFSGINGIQNQPPTGGIPQNNPNRTLQPNRLQPNYQNQPGGGQQAPYLNPNRPYRQPPGIQPLPGGQKPPYLNPAQTDNQPPAGAAQTPMRQNEVGEAGVLRLFTPPLDDETSWLLILALFSIPLVGAMVNWQRPFDEKFTGWLTWSLWLIPMALYFSLTTGLWHTYYLIMLGPGIAALSGMSVWALGRLFQRNRLAGWLVTLLLVGSTLTYEMIILNRYMTPYGWLIELIILLALTGLVLAALKPGWARSAALGLLAISLALAPFAWSMAAVLAGDSDSNLPNSGPGDIKKPKNVQIGTLNIFQNAVLEYTLANTQPDAYLLVGLSSNQTAPYILATGRPVLAIGGFSGNDSIFTTEELITRFQSGDLRFVLMSQEMNKQYTEFANWVTVTCEVVPLPENPQAMNQLRNPQAQQQAVRPDALFDCSK